MAKHSDKYRNVGEMIIAAAINKLHERYNVINVHSTSIRYCDFDLNKDVQDIAQVTIDATIAVQNSVLTHQFFITISDNDCL